MKSSQSIESVMSSSVGMTPEIANPNSVANGIVPLSAVLLILSTICLALRVYTKVRLLKSFFAEDCESETSYHEGYIADFRQMLSSQLGYLALHRRQSI